MSIFQRSLFQKLIKFGIVGTSGLCIDFSVTWLCREKFVLNQYVANTAGFTLAVCCNFLLNYTWTFKGQTNKLTKAFGSFLSIALIGLLLNNGIIYLCNQVLGLEFYHAKVMAVAVVFLWNFGANYFVTFRNKPNGLNTSSPAFFSAKSTI